MRFPLLLLGASLTVLAAPLAAQEAPPAAEAPAVTVGDLRSALVMAYNTNPDLQGERASLRATDEGVPLARSQGLPSVNATGGVQQSIYDTDQGIGPTRQGTLGANVSLPVYAGGSVRNSVRAAETRIEAGRSSLRSVEADVFTQVVTVYVDVLRDQAIVQLNQQNVKALSVNLQATRDRFEVGDLTRTDVAQSEARLAQAEGQLRLAEARLIASRENFIRVVGAPPADLSAPPPLPNLPGDVGVAVDTALASNPALEAVKKQRDASGIDVDVARAGRLPRVSVGVGTTYYNNLGSLSNTALLAGLEKDGVAATASVNLTMPLFQGGRPAAQVRQAQARESASIELVTLTERGVVAQARSAFATYQATLRVIESSRAAVDANRLSLEGVRAENSVGTRTILDILNAEQELLSAQVTYVTAERDAYLAGFTLLNAMGKANAGDLSLDGGALYDPTANYRSVRGSISDWSDGPEPAPVGTRTVGTPAQNSSVEGSLDPLLGRPVDSTGINP
ncbi:TolC family outer membrane protein [Sphingomonas canadensis]|uniref:TolC family outer membrane protein n=1 Tax=Sphingomonas canadensis TaxID=1219257 RepID=A0ABW3HEU3_9SPHN|nr:TolC family outer membrane protein [Sphingomonas canadensis]MCW3838017.1 TolC family outer membrane protein [Sphingomonas canadensis]